MLIRPTTVIHTILFIAGTIAVFTYYEPLHKDKGICDHVDACKKVSGNGTMESACPTTECSGDVMCCITCLGMNQGTEDTKRELVLESNLNVPLVFPIVGGLLSIFWIFVIVVHVIIKYMTTTPIVVHQRKQKTRVFAGVLLRLNILLVIILPCVVIIALIGDIEYYKLCQTRLTLLIGAFIIGLLILLDNIFSLSPRMSKTIRLQKDRSNALLLDDPREVAVELDVARNRAKTSGCVVCMSNRIVDVIGGLLLVYWVLAGIYFTLVAEGYWKPW